MKNGNQYYLKGILMPGSRKVTRTTHRLSSPCAEFFKALATVFLPLKAKEQLSWQPTPFLKGRQSPQWLQSAVHSREARNKPKALLLHPSTHSSQLSSAPTTTCVWKLSGLLLTFEGCPSSPLWPSSYPDVCLCTALEQQPHTQDIPLKAREKEFTGVDMTAKSKCFPLRNQ